MIQYFFEEVAPIPILETTNQWIEELIKNEKKKPGKISYIFCTDEGLLKINRDFLDHDYYTDVITFDYVKGATISADIFVSLPRISENASKLNSSFESELHRVLAHGVLHLCGYKDKTQQEIKIMRQKEEFYLAKLF